MSYTKRYAGGFVDTPTQTTAVDSTFLNNVETALVALFGVAPLTNGSLVWDGAKFTAANLLVNAQIDPAAAIAKTKLASLAIVDADVSGAAAIAQSKISGLSASLTAATIPPGVIAPYVAAAAPTGWLLCDASAVSRATYAALFAIISTTYGVGDGSTTFNVPDLLGRFPVGKGAHADVNALANSDGLANASRTPKIVLPSSGAGPGSSGSLVGAQTINHGYLTVTYIIKT